MKTVLSIAGSDCSGGAGIQADIRTITAHSCYAMTAITALTAQNTCGIEAIEAVSPSFLEKQLDCIFTDIFPDAVKTGMLADCDLIVVVSSKLAFYKAKNIVMDTPILSTSKTPLIHGDALDIMLNRLFPLADLITPNLSEAEFFTKLSVKTKSDMEKAAQALFDRTHTAILIKGGHLSGTADDLLFDGDAFSWFESERIANPNTHGTGCTLSASIASFMALGYSLKDSVGNAKAYLSSAISKQLNLGNGNGPLAIGDCACGVPPHTPVAFVKATENK